MVSFKVFKGTKSSNIDNKNVTSQADKLTNLYSNGVTKQLTYSLEEIGEGRVLYTIPSGYVYLVTAVSVFAVQTSDTGLVSDRIVSLNYGSDINSMEDFSPNLFFRYISKNNGDIINQTFDLSKNPVAIYENQVIMTWEPSGNFLFNGTVTGILIQKDLFSKILYQ